MNKKALFEYLHTVGVSLLIALFLAGIATGCSKIIAEQHAKMLAKMTNTAKDNEMINYLIKVYKEKAVDNPGDYSINVKLGNLYELIFDLSSAEEEYKEAISKSPYGVYSPYFGLASVYLKERKYNKALIIVKKLENKDHKPLLSAKGDFYMDLGNALWNDYKLKEALQQYKLAYFYYKKVNSTKKELAVNNILDCHDKIANEYFKKNQPQKALESLETSLFYKETPFIFYKLAILYKDIDPIKANEYIEKTYATDPGIINFDIYEEILIKLINHYFVNNKDIEMDLYRHKLKAIRSFQKRYVMTEDDIKINIEKIKYKSNFWKNKYKLNVKYTIENTSKYDFNTLYIIAKLRYEDKSRKIHSQKLYTKENPLVSRTTSTPYQIIYEYNDKDELYNAQKIWLDFYAGKKENMRKIPVFSLELVEN